MTKDYFFDGFLLRVRLFIIQCGYGFLKKSFRSTRFTVVDRAKFKNVLKRIENNSEIWPISEIRLIGLTRKKISNALSIGI